MESLTNTPSRPKRAFPSALRSARRASTGTAPSAQTVPSLAIKTPTKPSASTSAGIPAFRSLRSLLPFGPSKHATPASPAVPPTPNASKNSFYPFGSVRRSMQREDKASLDHELPPVISIDRVTRDELEGSTVRKSVSCSKLESMEGIQEGTLNPFQDDGNTIVLSMRRTPILRTPSPGPSISAELSIILEADSSGMSKHIPSSKDPSRASSPDMFAPAPEQSHIDTSVLDLSTSHIEDQVLGAMRSETCQKPQEWNVADQAIIIDGDGEDSDSFNLNALDPDLAAILTPYRFTAQRTNANVKNLTINTPRRSLSQPVNNFSNDSPQFVLAPSPIISGDSNLSSLNPLHLRLPRQQSSLPRLRPPISPSPHSPHSPAPSTVVPSPSASDTTRRGEDTRKTNPPSPFTFSTPPSAPPSPATAFTPPKTISSPLSSTAASMTSFFSRRSPTTKAQSSVLSLVSSQPASISTVSRLRTPFTQMSHLQRTASSSEADIPDVIRTFTPSSTSRLGPRPSFDSTSRESGSFDRPRPSLSSDTNYTSSGRPSLDTLRGTAKDAENAKTASAVLERARKRSLSVQDHRAGRHTLGVSRARGAIGEAGRRDEVDAVTEFGEQRPSSSQSTRMGRRWGGSRAESMTNGSAPVTEWLGPRTVKAFKAAGLLDFERDQQPHLDTTRNGPGSLSSSAGPTHGKFASMRSTSEYNPRAPSRLAMSEAGGSSASRRGSVSGTHGLMESPTFTASSGSRDTPRSASTAPTSVSGSSFVFLGRDRDREREEIRELKDKHASETEALLGALSDSQRTTKLLREENGELRNRLEQAEAEIDALRRVVGELTKETGDLRVQIQMLKSAPSTNSKLEPITRKSGLTASLRIDHDDDIGDNEWLNPVNGKERDKVDSQNRNGRIPDGGHHHLDSFGAQAGSAIFSSTPAAPKHKRRFSTTSSIFPIPPANMTMLLHDHDYEQDTGSLNYSLDQSQYSPSAPTPSDLHDDTITHNTSLTSVTSISPTTANFSMTTGSPASLSLRPEHELHLGDMDSLDFGITRNADVMRQDTWSD
ncbi:hypothetical protein C0995_006438 [Termitomyces sp. Mi166|nr:hypothetical protein C0995_006438 [Termitomyces sp. Mi166\